MYEDGSDAQAPAQPTPEWTAPQPEWAQAPTPEWAQAPRIPQPEWAQAPADAAFGVPLPPPPGEYFGSPTPLSTPPPRVLPVKRLLLGGLLTLVVVALTISSLMDRVALDPDSAYYSPERAVAHSLELMNDAVDDNDYDSFISHCDVEGFSASISAWSMGGSTVDLYKEYRGMAGKRNADKAWRRAYEERREFVEEVLEAAVRTGRVPSPNGGSLRAYEGFCGQISSIELSADGRTARVTAVIDAAVAGGDGTLTLQRQEDGSWTVIEVEPADAPG